MRSIPVAVAVGALFGFVLLFAFGLYALLTRSQRRTMREIRSGAQERGWKYRLRRWQGNPTSFRIDGQTANGVGWVMKSGNSGGYDRGWSTVLSVRFPGLAGATDFAIYPKDGRDSALMAAVAYGFEAATIERFARTSGTLAGAIEFIGKAREQPSHLESFDDAYRISVVPSFGDRTPVDIELAGNILHWPANTVAAHSILAWRDPFGLHLRARLPAPPNWATIKYLLSIGEGLLARLPAAIPVPEPSGAVDKMIAGLLK